jgi:acyl carrier protein
MDRAEVLERVREVVSDVLGLAVADVEPDDRLTEDLEAEKAQELELLDALEEEFDIDLDDDELLALSTVGEIAELIADITEEEGDLDEDEEEDDRDEALDEGEDNY